MSVALAKSPLISSGEISGVSAFFSIVAATRVACFFRCDKEEEEEEGTGGANTDFRGMDDDVGNRRSAV